MNVEIANIGAVDVLWATLGPKFNDVSRKCGDDLAAGELWQMCRSGNAFLIIATENHGLLMGAVVRFERWTDGLVLRVLSLVGERIEKWAADVKQFISDLGKQNGADRIVAEGRDGWCRIFDEPRKLRSTYVMEIN